MYPRKGLAQRHGRMALANWKPDWLSQNKEYLGRHNLPMHLYI
jgi:hypothetical protein